MPRHSILNCGAGGVFFHCYLACTKVLELAGGIAEAEGSLVVDAFGGAGIAAGAVEEGDGLVAEGVEAVPEGGKGLAMASADEGAEE